MPIQIPSVLFTAAKAIAGTLKAAKAAKTAALVGNALNVGSQLLTNRQQKRTNLEMYDRQRQDALADWNMQNMYNSPEAQMKRFKDAGLNPHLIYGQMTTASPIKTPDAKAPDYVAPKVDPEGLNVLGKQYALETQRLQLENMQKQGQLITAQTLKTNSETDWKNLNTKFGKDSFQTRLEALRIKNDYMEDMQDNVKQQYWLTKANTRKAEKEVDNIIANTNLSVARQAEVSQQVKNLIKTFDLLGERVITAQQENAFMKKIQAMGVAGQTAAALLRALKGGKP